MKRFLRYLLLALLVPLLLLALLAFAVLDAAPLVSREGTLSPAAVAQARQLFASHDPRRLRPGQRGIAIVPVSLLDQGAGHLAGRFLKARAAISLNDAGLALHLTRPLVGGRLHLNLQALLAAPAGVPKLVSARLGALPLPTSWLAGGTDRIAEAAGYAREWQLARQAVRHVALDPTAARVAIAYVWEPEILSRARAIALSGSNLILLREAQATLAATLTQTREPASPLLPVLQRLLPATGDDRHQRRRAGLLVLAVHLTGKSLASVAPEAGQWPRAPARELTLGGRHDLAQHFVASAALAAWADEPVADAIGLYKELQDARRGSGFSFVDLAADRAGSRFGELVVRQAEAIDRLLAMPLRETDLLPDVAGLPEYLREPEFRQRFGGPGQPAYQDLENEINRRLAGLPLYR
jgi:hypothetical protein